VHYSHTCSSGRCRRSVAPWITVLSWHTVFTIRVIYKFTLVWYSAKQGTTHRSTSHLTHLYSVPFLWPWEEHRRQWSWVDDVAGHCLLLQLSSRKTFFILSLVSAIRIPLMASSLSLTFPPAIAIDTYNGPPYLRSSVWLGTVAVIQCS
jgi:hypothetical protein